LSEIDYTIMPLFSTPLFIKNDVFISDEEKRILKSAEYERMKAGNGYYTKDKYILNKAEGLKINIAKAISQFVYEELKVVPTIHFYITNSWVVKHEKGDWAQMHAHTNCLISGVYYFDVNKDSGRIYFHKEANHFSVFPMHMDLDITDHNILNAKAWNFIPENGQLFLFPSWLQHSVSENKSDQERHSLAFNVYIKGKIGTKEFQMEIK